MSWTIPSSTQYSYKLTDPYQQGIGVWSLQLALTNVGYSIVADGIFGKDTKTAVVSYQSSKNLVADGIAGPATQKALSLDLVNRADTGLPEGLLRGFAEMEGGYLFGAVNRSVAGGVDCGVFQRRVYSEDYQDDEVIERAFNTLYQAKLLATSLRELREIFVTRTGTQDGYGGMSKYEKAWRLAALNHNYPSGAQTLSKTPVKNLSAYWTQAQDWVTIHAYKFPDGTPVTTPLQWCHLYAGVLGKGVYGHNGNVTKYVTSWSTTTTVPRTTTREDIVPTPYDPDAPVQPGKTPTNKWLAFVVTGAAGLLTSWVATKGWSDEETIAAIALGTQAVLGYFIPNSPTPGGVPDAQ